MNVSVVPEMVLPPEGLATYFTGVGPLVRVRALVDQQVVGLGELALAELADEPLLRAGAAARPTEQARVKARRVGRVCRGGG